MSNSFQSISDIDVAPGSEQYSLGLNCPATSKARTTFFAKDAETTSKQRKFRRFWRLQHGRGHTYEDWTSQRIRQEDVFTYRRSRAIVSQLDVPEYIRELVAKRVLAENLNGFSRYYKGLDGATIGFAALFQFENKEAALKSNLVEKCEEMFEIDGEKLIKYVWKKYRD